MECDEGLWMNSYDSQAWSVGEEKLSKKPHEYCSDFFILKIRELINILYQLKRIFEAP